jgi:putative transposase
VCPPTGVKPTKVPEEGAEEILAHARAVHDAPTYETGEAQAASLIELFGEIYPAAVKSFADDLEASLAHLKPPIRHRINVRTTNLLGEELPRREAPHEGDPTPPR